VPDGHDVVIEGVEFDIDPIHSNPAIDPCSTPITKPGPAPGFDFSGG
jgi:hypothetical protein